jgi:cell division protein FtsW (lipid II flippase)
MFHIKHPHKLLLVLQVVLSFLGILFLVSYRLSLSFPLALLILVVLYRLLHLMSKFLLVDRVVQFLSPDKPS